MTTTKQNNLKLKGLEMSTQQLAYKIAFGNALHGNKAKLSKEGGKWVVKIGKVV